MKIKRVWLLRILLALGALLILYTVLRQAALLNIGEENERFFINAIVFIALGIFIYNRKLSADELKEKAEKAALEKQAAETEDPPG
jgi:cadmium resistance protein CadD (predicted permease)